MEHGIPVAYIRGSFLGHRRWLAGNSRTTLRSLLLEGRRATPGQLVLSLAEPRRCDPLALPCLPSLTALSLRGSRTLSDAGLAALLRPLAPTLVTLCLSGCTLVGEATYIALGGGVGSGAAPRLREIDLSCGAVPQANTP